MMLFVVVAVMLFVAYVISRYVGLLMDSDILKNELVRFAIERLIYLAEVKAVKGLEKLTGSDKMKEVINGLREWEERLKRYGIDVHLPVDDEELEVLVQKVFDEVRDKIHKKVGD